MSNLAFCAVIRLVIYCKRSETASFWKAFIFALFIDKILWAAQWRELKRHD